MSKVTAQIVGNTGLTRGTAKSVVKAALPKHLGIPSSNLQVTEEEKLNLQGPTDCVITISVGGDMVFPEDAVRAFKDEIAERYLAATVVVNVASAVV